MKNLEKSRHQNGRTVCFAVLLALSVSSYIVLNRLTARQRSDSAAPLHFTDATLPNSLGLAPGLSAQQSSTWVEPSVLSAKFAPGTRPFLRESYAKNPLAFEANEGQADARVKFLSRGADYALFFTSNEAVVAMRKPAPESSAANSGSEAQPFAVMHMHFVGGNHSARVSASDELPGKVNYFIGNDPRHWRSGIPTFARVRYEDLYSGVSVVYYGTPGRLEYDLVIAPGVDPGIIALDCQGASQVRIDPQGNLRLLVGGSELLLSKPLIYQMMAKEPARRKSIPGGYYLKAGGHVGFQVGEYDRSQPLIVDPVLTYSTYLGGSGYDAGTAIAVDSSGNTYVTGFTRSTNFPVTAGALKTTCGTTGTCNGYFWDAFVTKLNPSGQLVYSTYLGGSATDIGKAIAVDGSGSVYIAGQTFSSDFPTTAGAFNATYAGAGDVFLAKLDATGASLQYSTYLGGTGIDNAEGIAIDASGNAYVTGQTYSTDFPTFAAIQALSGGNQDSDAFVTEVNSTGSALVYSTYLGGGSMDWGNAIALDASGDAYVAGFTRSTDFPLAGALQAVCGGCPGFADAFLAELAPSGTSLLYSTYLGGSGDDQAAGITVDSGGNIYVTGFTYSTDFPITPGAYQTTLTTGQSAAFVTKIAPGFSSLTWSTYLEGPGLNYGRSIAADTGNVFVAGLTYSPTFPVLLPTQSTCAPSNCYYGTGFIAELNASASGLIFSTYLGGSHGDDIAALALDSSANIQATGQATSTDFPVVNAFQTAMAGSYGDAFVTKISLQPAASPSPTSLTFGSQPVGSTSSPQAVTLSSNGTAPLHITSVSVSGDFAETDKCTPGVAAGSTCTINVTFTPTSIGTRTGMLTVNDNASDSPQQVNLTGTGVGGPILNPASFSFGNQNVGTTSGAKTIQLKNAGTSTLNISSVAISGTDSTDFAQTNDCPNSLAPGAQCNINVTFTPAAIGTLTAALSVSDDALDSPQNASLTGSGISGTTSVTLTPNKLSFGNQATGSTSTPQTTVLKNTGSSTLVISSIAIAGPNLGDFAQTNDCGNTVAVGASCTFSVTFTPNSSGNRSATLSITDNAGGSPQKVNLTGTGVGPTATLNPTSLSFGNQNVGTTSGPKGVQVKNTGNAALALSGITITGTNASNFLQTNNCPASLAPGAQCNINVKFSPTATGTRTASLSVSDNAFNSPQTASLTGTGQ